MESRPALASASSQIRGPHRGQAMFWAWNRRSVGIGVFAQAVRTGREIHHRRPLAIERGRHLDAEPRARSPCTREREPVAAVAGVVELGEAGRAGRQVGGDHTTPGSLRRRIAAASSLGKITKPKAPSGEPASATISWISAAGGRSRRADGRMRRWMTAGPSRWMVSPSGVFLTQPASLSVAASRTTKGRNPTPCTRPRMRNRPRAEPGQTGAHGSSPCSPG